MFGNRRLLSNLWRTAHSHIYRLCNHGRGHKTSIVMNNLFYFHRWCSCRFGWNEEGRTGIVYRGHNRNWLYLSTLPNQSIIVMPLVNRRIASDRTLLLRLTEQATLNRNRHRDGTHTAEPLAHASNQGAQETSSGRGGGALGPQSGNILLYVYIKANHMLLDKGLPKYTGGPDISHMEFHRDRSSNFV